jgi:hypothetical protein
VAHPGRGKLGERPKLPAFEKDAAPTEPGKAAPDRDDLCKLPPLAPLASSKER